MSDKNSELKAVSKVLGEPIFGELSENILKIRRNLLVISLVSIFVIYGDLRIDPNSTIFGLKFRGLTENIIVYGLSIANTYLFLHYLWCCFDSFAEWRVRVTGTRLTYITTARVAGNHQDYPKMILGNRHYTIGGRNKRQVLETLRVP